MSSAKNVLVVGGGISGMSLAIGLATAGIAVDVIDIDPQWRAVGDGITVNAASLLAFERVGVLDRIREEGDIHRGLILYDAGGALIHDGSREGGTRAPEPGGGILRPVLHRILADATMAHGATVRLGISVNSFDQNEDVVVVAFSDHGKASYSLVVGADGIHSSMRSLLFPNASAPELTGQGCWRAVFPRSRDMKAAEMYLSSHYKAGLNPVSRDEMYLFLLESVPLNSSMPPDEWPRLLKERLAPFGGRLAEVREQIGEESRINYRPLKYLLLPPPWFAGRVVLIGDAAHATTPHCAYGAGTRGRGRGDSGRAAEAVHG